VNGDFDTGAWPPWEIDTEIGAPGLTQQQYHSAPYSARLGGSVDTHDYIGQLVTVPSNASEVTLDFWDRTSGSDPSPDDHICVEILNNTWTEVLWGDCFALYETVPQNQWIKRHGVISGAELAPLLGQTVYVSFNVHNNDTNPGTVWVDDVSFKVTRSGS
jgi:hypothetical protein